MSRRRALMMAIGGGGKVLFLRIGVDTTFSTTLTDGALECQESGGAGEHDGLMNTDCFFSRPAGWYSIGDAHPEEYADIWELGNPLPLGIQRITGVELLYSGRENTQVIEGEDYDTENDNCVAWTENSLVINDPGGSSTVYELKITFE